MRQAAPGGERMQAVNALKSGLLAALVMTGLCFPIVAFQATPDFSNQLQLVTRWPLVAAFAGTAFVLRFFTAFLGGRRWRTRPSEAAALPQPSGALIAVEKGLGLAGLAALVAFPFAMLAIFGRAGSLKWIDNYGIQILIYVMLGWGLNIVVGLAGLLDLGYIAFYAVGAYACALLSTHGWSFWLCLPAAGLIAALWGIILGFPVLRLRGDYLAIVTLAFGEIIRLVLLNWSEVTNGDAGIGSIPKITFFGLSFAAGKTGFANFFGIAFSPIQRTIFLFYVILLLALATNLVAVRLRRLPIGRAWEALREDEIACRALGINTVVTKLSAFALGAAFGGLAGAFFAVRQGFVSPSSFTFIESATVLAIVVLGGRGSQIGVAAAAIVMIGGSELLRELDILKELFGADFDPTQYRMLIVGLAMIVMMNFKPQGLVARRRPSILMPARKFVPAGRPQGSEV
jgi:branched-chain amino acid transport system permease protein